MPEDLSGLTYATQGDWGGDVWGSDTRPAKLEADEYFVLGDFSLRAKDSRLWRDVEPGHNPFAVPSANLYGVVTHTYWPRNRWRIHR